MHLTYNKRSTDSKVGEASRFALGAQPKNEDKRQTTDCTDSQKTGSKSGRPPREVVKTKKTSGLRPFICLPKSVKICEIGGLKFGI
jgi:hypothetical protein